MRIAVVDDQIDVCTLVRFVLEAEGHEVHVHDTGFDALLDPAAWEGVGLAIIDVNLSGSVTTGVDVLRFLRDRCSHVHRVAFTASTDLRSALPDGLAEVVDKSDLQSLRRIAGEGRDQPGTP